MFLKMFRSTRISPCVFSKFNSRLNKIHELTFAMSQPPSLLLNPVKRATLCISWFCKASIPNLRKNRPSTVIPNCSISFCNRQIAQQWLFAKCKHDLMIMRRNQFSVFYLFYPQYEGNLTSLWIFTMSSMVSFIKHSATFSEVELSQPDMFATNYKAQLRDSLSNLYSFVLSYLLFIHLFVTTELTWATGKGSAE